MSATNTNTGSPTIAAPQKSADNRPWHNHENPFEALYQFVESKIGAGAGGEVSSLKAKVASMEQKLVDLERKLEAKLRPESPAQPNTGTGSASGTVQTGAGISSSQPPQPAT